jgi:hypothetical protein
MRDQGAALLFNEAAAVWKLVTLDTDEPYGSLGGQAHTPPSSRHNAPMPSEEVPACHPSMENHVTGSAQPDTEA